MTDRMIERSNWTDYFTALSRRAEGDRVEVHVQSLQLGDQIEAEWARLLGMAYDPKDDIVEIALDGVDHLIARPKEVRVHAEKDAVDSVQIVDGDDNRQIVRFKAPVSMPAR